MPRTKTQKKEIIEKLKKDRRFSQDNSLRQFPRHQSCRCDKIRRKLKSENVGLFVAKKIFDKKSFWRIKGHRRYAYPSGEVALAYGADIVASAREIYAFQKEYKDASKSSAAYLKALLPTKILWYRLPPFRRSKPFMHVRQRHKFAYTGPCYWAEWDSKEESIIINH